MMWNASNTLVRARKYFIPRRWNSRAIRISTSGNTKKGYYYGNSDEYRTFYLHSEHWKQLRTEKLSKFPTCEECGAKERVEPHHLIYKNLYDITLEDLKTLCRRCHSQSHNSDWIEYVKEQKEGIRKRDRARLNRLIRRTSRLGHLKQAVVKDFIRTHGW